MIKLSKTDREDNCTRDNMKEAANCTCKSDCDLTEDNLLNVARNELGENPLRRQQCLDQLRNWLSKNTDIINMRMDDGFLLRFLRTNKFNLPMTEQMILKYLNIRRVFPHLSTKLDYYDERLNQILSNGYIFATPNRDKYGRRVVIVNAQYFDPKLYGCIEQARIHFFTYECLMEDPINQVMGVTHIGDFMGVSAQHITNWNPGEFARIFKWGEQSLPMRHKAVHLLKVPGTLKWLIEFGKSRVSDKMQQRLQLHNNVKELIEAVGAECLPKEWGGLVPMRDMIELWKNELRNKNEIILKLDQMQLLSDRGIKTKRNCCTEHMKNSINDLATYLQGSFRQLEID